MKRLAAALAVLGASCAPAGGQFASAPGLTDALAEISAAAAAAKRAAAKPDVAGYPVRGIDVSHYQGTIDWSKIPGQGLAFVYIKATDGSAGTDAEFGRNWAGAAIAGLRRGAYHFYDFCQGGAAQADHFIKTVPVDADALPATVDFEASAECRKMPSKAAFQKQLAVFLRKMRAAYGRKPVLYVNDVIYSRYLAGAADGYALWVSDPGHASPQLSAGADWTLWQYSYSGRVDGVPNAVDLDVFRGTPE